ncbi:MAG TPA: hypothetical protein VD978_27920 [Azospirillum sp.]|nr:hypothetical protein [Azospirillum sp.]
MRVLLVLLALLLASAASAQEAQYARRTAALTDTPAGGEGGSLVVATPLQVLEHQGDRALVRINAWYPEGNPAMLYERPGKRVLAAMPKGASAAAMQGLGETAIDETGQSWTRVSLTAWVAGEDVTADRAAVWAEAEALFASRCTVCHERRVPARYTANQLFVFLQTMGQRAQLARDERVLVLKYLQSQAKDATE